MVGDTENWHTEAFARVVDAIIARAISPRLTQATIWTRSSSQENSCCRRKTGGRYAAWPSRLEALVKRLLFVGADARRIFGRVCGLQKRISNDSSFNSGPTIAVVGAGAVGGYFGGMFAHAGAPVVFVGRRHFADAVNSNGLVLDYIERPGANRGQATTEISAVRDCSLILFCVKANDTSETAKQWLHSFGRIHRRLLARMAWIMRIGFAQQNEWSSSYRLRFYVRRNRRQKSGRVKHLSRGDLIIRSAF